MTDCDHPDVRPVVSTYDPDEACHLVSAMYADDGLVVFATCEACGADMEVTYQYVETAPASATHE